MTTTPTRAAVSKVGQVARVRGDVGHLPRELTAPYTPIHPTDRPRIPGDRTRTMTHRTTKATLTPTPVTDLPPLDQHLTHRDVTVHYGLSNGSLGKLVRDGKIRRHGRIATGTGGGLDLLDHRDIIDAFHRGFIGRPRAGGPANLTEEQRDLWRANIHDAITRLLAERAADAEPTPEATPAPAPTPEAVAITPDPLSTPRPVMPAPATPTPPSRDLLLLELAHLRGMVSMVADAGQRDALLAQLDRVIAEAGA